MPVGITIPKYDILPNDYEHAVFRKTRPFLTALYSTLGITPFGHLCYVLLALAYTASFSLCALWSLGLLARHLADNSQVQTHVGCSLS
jgi:hypothetical protein